MVAAVHATESAQLEADGFFFTGPTEGWQACRAVGPGRMQEPEAIFDEATRLVGAEPSTARPRFGTIRTR
ncbi:MAG: hypothetical protein ACFHWZ_12530 [Phycisphaerales bacterium]